MDSLVFSLSVSLIGMLVVFVGLCILIVSIKAITSLSAAGGKKQKADAPAKSVAAPTPAPAAVSAPAQNNAIPADVIAAITAAIAAVWDGKGGFTVRRVRRVSNASAWNRAGREDQIYSRF